MRCFYACNSAEHDVSRRQFLAASAAGTLGWLGFGGLMQPAVARDLKRGGKRVLLVWLHGGVSQLETWDPKPGTDTGGPFRSIPTSVPGIRISELLPYTAQQMHRMALIRSLNTKENNHSKGAVFMHTGRREQPGMAYPHLGSAMAKLLGSRDNPLPGYIHITPRGSGQFNKKDAAFLGPRYASVTLGDGKPPRDLERPVTISAAADLRRNALRQRLNDRFARRRRTAETDAFTETFEQAARLMERKELFDLAMTPPRQLDRYGTHDFGRHCFLARRLLENGATFVKVTHTNYDTHHENFDFHIEQMGEFDRTFATLLSDLADTGLLDSTLVIVMSEFGRTPRINQRDGRDHWSKAWSVALAGCGIQPGAVIGKTNANGTAVTDREVDARHLFHTYFRALGLNPKKNYYVNGRPIPMADPSGSAIEELLA